MKRLSIHLLVTSGLFLLLFTQCLYEETPEPVIPAVVSFSEDIVPIFEANCNSSFCHAKNAEKPDLTPDNAWENLQSGYLNLEEPASSLLVTKMVGGSMDTYASDQDVALILQWITDGADNN